MPTVSFLFTFRRKLCLAATTEPPDGIKPGPFYTAVFLLNYLYWAAGTLLGGLLGSLLPL